MTSQIFAPTLRIKNGRFMVQKDRRTGRVVTDLAEMARLEFEDAIIEEMITTTDTKEYFTTAINDFFLQVPDNTDTGWQQLFRVIPMTTGSGMKFPIRDRDRAGEGSHGIVFKVVGEGGEITFDKVSSRQLYIEVQKRATALNYSSEWFEDSDLGLIQMTTEDFRIAYFDSLAVIHYGILTAAQSSGVSKTTPVSGSALDDFIATVNATVAVMQRNRYIPTHIVHAPEQEAIVEAMLTDVNRDGSATKSSRRLTPVQTEHFPAGMVCIANTERLISLDRRQLRLNNFSDLLHDGEALVGTFRRGAALAEGLSLRFITGL